MTVDPQCYVCGKEELCINGLCHDCTMKEFRNPGAAFAATFGTLLTDDELDVVQSIADDEWLLSNGVDPETGKDFSESAAEL